MREKNTSDTCICRILTGKTILRRLQYYYPYDYAAGKKELRGGLRTVRQTTAKKANAPFPMSSRTISSVRQCLAMVVHYPKGCHHLVGLYRPLPLALWPDVDDFVPWRNAVMWPPYGQSDEQGRRTSCLELPPFYPLEHEKRQPVGQFGMRTLPLPFWKTNTFSHEKSSCHAVRCYWTDRPVSVKQDKGIFV